MRQFYFRYLNNYHIVNIYMIIKKVKKNKKRCELCNGSGLLKQEVIICPSCNGNSCMKCNERRYIQMPYEECTKCFGFGEIKDIPQ